MLGFGSSLGFGSKRHWAQCLWEMGISGLGGRNFECPSSIAADSED